MALKRNQEGFTLIELMVVVMIIAILLAMAVPTFIGARKRGQDAEVRSNLKTAMSALMSEAKEKPRVTPTAAQMKAAEASLTWQLTTPPTGPKTISYYAYYAPEYVHVTYLIFGAQSASGKCHGIYYLENLSGTRREYDIYGTYDPPCGYYGYWNNNPVPHGGNLVTREGGWPT